MEIRHIFAPIIAKESEEITVSTVLAIAKHLKAHAEVILVCEKTSDTIPYLGIGEYLTPELDEAFKRRVDAEACRAIADARHIFQRLCEEYEVQVVQEPRGPGASSARLRTVTGRLEETVPRIMRLSDMGVFSGPFQQERLTPNLLQKTLLGSGRPLLFTPWQSVVQPLKHVAIAWNGSAPAARAVLAAQSFLKQAERIDVLYVKDDASSASQVEQLAEYLIWHGLQSECQTLERNDAATGQTLLDAASELSADLFVMGAYAHNWYEEIILGSTTHFVLQNT